MSAERPLYSPDVSGVHKLELVPEVLPEPKPKAPDVANRTPAAPGIGDTAPTNLDAPELYLNRELTYLNFCWRVLQEADDDRTPLLERLKFVAIVSSHIDE